MNIIFEARYTRLGSAFIIYHKNAKNTHYTSIQGIGLWLGGFVMAKQYLHCIS